VPNESADIAVEVVGGQTVLVNLRAAGLKIVWKANVSPAGSSPVYFRLTGRQFLGRLARGRRRRAVERDGRPLRPDGRFAGNGFVAQRRRGFRRPVVGERAERRVRIAHHGRPERVRGRRPEGCGVLCRPEGRPI